MQNAKQYAAILGVFFLLYFGIWVWKRPGPDDNDVDLIQLLSKSSKDGHSKLDDMKTGLSFHNPAAAKKALDQLETYEPIDSSLFELDDGSAPEYNDTFLGLTYDQEYCDNFRRYVVERPDELFRVQNYFIDRNNDSNVRRFIELLGNNKMPIVSQNMDSTLAESKSLSLDPTIHNFFTSLELHRHQELGKTFGCLFQQYSHIPGHAHITKKVQLAQSISAYHDAYKSRPQCFSYDKLFPQIWIMKREDECRDFFDNYLNTEKFHKMRDRFKLHYGPHPEEHVAPASDDKEQQLRELYKNGTLCGQVNKNYLMHRYIYNPLLIQEKRTDFRVFMLLASTNPIIAFYHDGYARVSLTPFDPNKQENLINNDEFEYYHNEAKNGNLLLGMSAKEIREAHFWSMERFQDYLIETGRVSDPHWLDNTFRPSVKKALIHILRATKDKLYKSSQVYELFGVDFVLDEDLNLWFIEAEHSPRIEPYDVGDIEDREPFFSIVTDMFDITFSLARSRLTRAIKYINKLTADPTATVKGFLKDFKMENPEEKIKEFKEITKNKFDIGFEPRFYNTFTRFMDESKEGAKAYFGLLEEDCL